MKKFILWFLGILLFIFLGTWAWLSNRQVQALKMPVPKNAASLLKINADALIRQLLWSSITDPGSAKDSAGEEKKSDNWWRHTGIALPGSIFISELRSSNGTAWYTLLNITDSADLRQVLVQKLRLPLDSAEGKIFGANDRNTFAYRASAKQIVFAFSPEGNVETDAMDAMLAGTDLVQAKESDLYQEADAPIVLLRKDSRISIDSKSEQLQINVELKQMLKALAKGDTPAETNGLLLNCKIDPSSIPQHDTIKAGGYFLETDSLSKYLDGRMILSVGGSEIQLDSIVAYEYDENFEKQEVFSTEEKKVPGVWLKLGGNAAGLSAYLEQQGFLQPPNKFNREIFPLIQLTKSTDNSGLTLSNRPVGEVTVSNTDADDEWLQLKATPESFRDFFPASIVEKYLSAITEIEATGITTVKGSFIHGSIHFRKKGVNAFRQLLAMF